MAQNRLADHRVLTSIAKSVSQFGQSDADWIEEIKTACVRQGWSWQDAEALTRAIRSVESAHGRGEPIDVPTPSPPVPEPLGFSPAEAKAAFTEWHKEPDPTLLDLAREAVRLHPGTDWRRCHVQLKAMETAAISAGITFTWGLLSVALIKAQRELVLELRQAG